MRHGAADAVNGVVQRSGHLTDLVLGIDVGLLAEVAIRHLRQQVHHLRNGLREAARKYNGDHQGQHYGQSRAADYGVVRVACRRFGILLAVCHELCLCVRECCDLAAKLVEVLLAAGFADQVRHVVHRLRITDLAAQGDGRLGDVCFPVGDRRLDFPEQLHLPGVVVDSLLPRGGFLCELLASRGVGIEELVFAGQQVTAHAGFHFDGRRQKTFHLGNHFMSMIDPSCRFADGLDAVGHTDGRRIAFLFAFLQQGRFPCDDGRDLAAELVEVLLAAGFADQARHVVHRLRITDLAA